MESGSMARVVPHEMVEPATRFGVPALVGPRV
jgi:hypothetical protein